MTLRDPSLTSVSPLSADARRTTTDHIADALRRSILTGELPDGAELNQVALAENFGVSRVPVREALRQLQAEGLVQSTAHKRTVVNSMSLDELMEVFDIRLSLELYMLGRAMDHMDQATLHRCAELCQQLEQEKDRHAWTQINAEFHRQLFGPARCQVSAQISEQLAARAVRYLYLLEATDPTAVTPTGWAEADNRELLAAVASENRARARALVRRHIEATRERVRCVVEAASQR